jgi:hypothetical protein
VLASHLRLFIRQIGRVSGPCGPIVTGGTCQLCRTPAPTCSQGWEPVSLHQQREEDYRFAVHIDQPRKIISVPAATGSRRSLNLRIGIARYRAPPYVLRALPIGVRKHPVAGAAGAAAGLARAQKHSAHGALHRAGTGQVQKLLARLGSRSP